MTSFEARDLGEAKHYLGIKITRDRGSRTIKLSQELMTTELVAKYGLSDGKVKNVPLSPSIRLSTEEGEPIDQGKYPYSQLVGSLLYLAVTTRPDIGFAVGVFGQTHELSYISTLASSKGSAAILGRNAGLWSYVWQDMIAILLWWDIAMLTMLEIWTQDAQQLGMSST